MSQDVSAALDAYAAAEKVSRPQAIRTILAEGLRTHGFGVMSGVKPTGPATDAVESMDAAIKKDRRKK